MNEQIVNFVRKLAKKQIKSSRDFLKWKNKLASGLKMPQPSNVDILAIYRTLRPKGKIGVNQYLAKQLKKRPVRSLSGVAVVSVLTKPWPCPGRCLYCPLEPGIPKSYLSGEPAVERAKLLKYNPYEQVRKRIEALERTGHPVDKIELIVIGGTWSFLPENYQTWFIKRCFDGANHKISSNLNQAQKINEKTKHRIIGMTLETRPDYITPEEILRMRKLGCTRVELGVQTIDEPVLKINKRGHGLKEIIQATKLLKDAGFKICYHLMPGLPGSTPKKDLAVFKKIFSDSNFQPDMLKIYPCVVTKGSELYKLWRKKHYQPYTDKQLLNLLVKIKSIIPPYVRIIRVVRDIPSPKIEGGSKISNLREVIQKEMRKRGLKCRCIRCREVKDLKLKISASLARQAGLRHAEVASATQAGGKKLKLIRKNYQASGGKEIFLSYENIKNDKLVAFLRLRLPTKSEICNLPFKILKDAALIREVHTYGEQVPIGQKKDAAQHLGLGKRLITEAEKIAQNAGYKKIAVIAGVGVREYYRQLDYKLQDTYMTKSS